LKEPLNPELISAQNSLFTTDFKSYFNLPPSAGDPSKLPTGESAKTGYFPTTSSFFGQSKDSVKPSVTTPETKNATDNNRQNLFDFSYLFRNNTGPLKAPVTTSDPATVITSEPVKVTTSEPATVITSEPVKVITTEKPSEPAEVTTTEPVKVTTSEPVKVITPEKHSETPEKPSEPAELITPEKPPEPVKVITPEPEKPLETPEKPSEPAELITPEKPPEPVKVITPEPEKPLETPEKPSEPAELITPEKPPEPVKVITPEPEKPLETPEKPSEPAELITPEPEKPPEPAELITPEPEKPSEPAELITPEPEKPSEPAELITPEPEKPSEPAELITPEPEKPSETTQVITSESSDASSSLSSDDEASEKDQENELSEKDQEKNKISETPTSTLIKDQDLESSSDDEKDTNDKSSKKRKKKIKIPKTPISELIKSSDSDSSSSSDDEKDTNDKSSKKRKKIPKKTISKLIKSSDSDSSSSSDDDDDKLDTAHSDVLVLLSADASAAGAKIENYMQSFLTKRGKEYIINTGQKDLTHKINKFLYGTKLDEKPEPLLKELYAMAFKDPIFEPNAFKITDLYQRMNIYKPTINFIFAFSMLHKTFEVQTIQNRKQNYRALKYSYIFGNTITTTNSNRYPIGTEKFTRLEASLYFYNRRCVEGLLKTLEFKQTREDGPFLGDGETYLSLTCQIPYLTNIFHINSNLMSLNKIRVSWFPIYVNTYDNPKPIVKPITAAPLKFSFLPVSLNIKPYKMDQNISDLPNYAPTVVNVTKKDYTDVLNREFLPVPTLNNIYPFQHSIHKSAIFKDVSGVYPPLGKTFAIPTLYYLSKASSEYVTIKNDLFTTLISETDNSFLHQKENEGVEIKNKFTENVVKLILEKFLTNTIEKYQQQFDNTMQTIVGPILMILNVLILQTKDTMGNLIRDCFIKYVEPLIIITSESTNKIKYYTCDIDTTKKRFNYTNPQPTDRKILTLVIFTFCFFGLLFSRVLYHLNFSKTQKNKDIDDEYRYRFFYIFANEMTKMYQLNEVKQLTQIKSQN
jgi:hypothetical protein